MAFNVVNLCTSSDQSDNDNDNYSDNAMTGQSTLPKEGTYMLLQTSENILFHFSKAYRNTIINHKLLTICLSYMVDR